MRPEPEGSGYLEAATAEFVGSNGCGVRGKQRLATSWEATAAESVGSNGCGVRGKQRLQNSWEERLRSSWEATAGDFDGRRLARRVRGRVGEDEGAVLLEAVKMVGLKVGEGLRAAVGPDDFDLVDEVC